MLDRVVGVALNYQPLVVLADVREFQRNPDLGHLRKVHAPILFSADILLLVHHPFFINERYIFLSILYQSMLIADYELHELCLGAPLQVLLRQALVAYLYFIIGHI